MFFQGKKLSPRLSPMGRVQMVDELDDIGSLTPPTLEEHVELERNLSITNLNRIQNHLHHREIHDNDKNLVELDYSHSKIKKIEPYLTIKLDLSKLKMLTLDNNEIIEIGEDFPLLPSLERLYLNNNNISNLELFLIRIKCVCPKIMYLSLIGNPCCTLDHQYRLKIISELPTLIFLDTSPVKDEEKKQVTHIYGNLHVNEEDSDDSTDSNDGFESHDEEEEIIREIEKAKKRMESQKQKIESLKQETIILDKKKNVTERAIGLLNFFDNNSEYRFLRNQLLLKDQIHLSLDMLEITTDLTMIDRNVEILSQLISLFQDEKKDIVKYMDIMRREKERMQREEEIRLERKKIADEFKRLEDFERERIMRKKQQEKELAFEKKVEAKRAEDDLSFALLEEESLKVSPENPVDDDEILLRMRAHLSDLVENDSLKNGE